MSSLDFESLSPVNFFTLTCQIQAGKAGKLQKKHLLPTSCLLTHEEPVAEVSLAWSSDGLAWSFHFSRELRWSKTVDSGDAIELFIDTRDVKSPTCTPYCHHFFFLPSKGASCDRGELTQFRNDEGRALAEPKSLEMHVENKRIVKLFLPSKCLHGFEPIDFPRLGIQYRIRNSSGEEQHFSSLSNEFKFENNPSLWASARLNS